MCEEKEQRFWWLVERWKGEAGSDRSGQNSPEASLLLFLSPLLTWLLLFHCSHPPQFTVTSCHLLWLWPVFWAEAPEPSLSVKAAWATREKKLFVPLTPFLLCLCCQCSLPLYCHISYFSSRGLPVLRGRDSRLILLSLLLRVQLRLLYYKCICIYTHTYILWWICEKSCLNEKPHVHWIVPHI